MKDSNQFRLFLLGVVMLFTGAAHAQNGDIATQLQQQLKQIQNQNGLHYPASVNRFYKENGFHLAWVVTEDDASQTFKAMMLLDCVLQYGLLHADYHPSELTYDKLHIMINNPEKTTNSQKAAYDIMLTDAMVTLINHLHFGKVNPAFPPETVDNQVYNFFVADAILQNAIQAQDFTTTILSVQPKSTVYQAMQDYMRLVKGQYTGDCYQIPESNIRKVAINMERLRWAEIHAKRHISKKYLYLTCSIKDGLPIFRKDIYHQDKALEAALYNNHPSSTKKQPVRQAAIKLKPDL